MLKLLGFVARLVTKIPGVTGLLEWLVARGKREARAIDGASRRQYIAVQLDLIGIPPIAGAAIAESLTAGIAIAAGISPANDRPFSMFFVAPAVPHDRRREIYEELRSQLDKAIATTIDVPR